MSTTAIVSIIISSVCLIWAVIRVFKKAKQVYHSDKITLGRDGGKKITISKKPTDEDRRKLVHL